MKLVCALTCLLLCHASLPVLAQAAQPSATVTGCVEVADQQSYRGVASLWDVDTHHAPDPRKYIVIPTVSTSLQANGCFEVQATSGSYYVGAIVRMTPGPTMGPPRPGDLVFMSPSLAGDAVEVVVTPGQTLALGVTNQSWPYVGFTAPHVMGVRGRVVDSHGKPVAGLLVFAFADREVTGSPLAVSERTSAAGLYELRLDKPGEIYLRVKESYGDGMPTPGGYVGIYGTGTPQALEVASDEVVEAIEIEVLQVPEQMSGARKVLPGSGAGQASE